MHYILSLCKSHIYELHALLAGTITFLSMFLIKKPLKFDVEKYTCPDPEENKRIKKNRELRAKRLNSLLVFETMMVGIILYCFLDFVSPLIQFSLKTAILTGVVALVEYALYEQLATERKGLSK